MFHSALYMRMVQNATGLDQDTIYHIFNTDQKKVSEINRKLSDIYKNVRFCFKTGQTPDEIDDTILDTEDKIGRKVKLCIFDYNELIISTMSDGTAASAQVAQRIRQTANEKEICALQLLQPSKNYSSPGDEIVNFNAAKGSSSIVQSLTLMLGCSRPGFDPRRPEQDKYFNITCLKNRNGPLFSIDLSWNGLKGSIGKLEDHQRAELEALRAAKEAEEDDGWD
jgi:replicative DNA helicase